MTKEKLWFQVHHKATQKLKYLNTSGTHMNVTSKSTPSGIFDQLTTLTSGLEFKNSIKLKGQYPGYNNALIKSGLSPNTFPSFKN